MELSNNKCCDKENKCDISNNPECSNDNIVRNDNVDCEEESQRNRLNDDDEENQLQECHPNTDYDHTNADYDAIENENENSSLTKNGVNIICHDIASSNESIVENNNNFLNMKSSIELESRLSTSSPSSTASSNNTNITTTAHENEIPTTESNISVFNNNNNNNTTCSNNNTNTNICSICLGEYQQHEDICKSNNTECQHYFHLDCMMPWLMNHNECPLCRIEFVKDSGTRSSGSSSHTTAVRPIFPVALSLLRHNNGTTVSSV